MPKSQSLLQDTDLGSSSGRYLRRILESTAEGVYGLDPQGRITFVNKAAVRLTGWPREEQIGQYAHSLIHHSHVDGSPYPEEDCPVLAPLRDGEPRHVDEWFWHMDGKPFPVTLTSAPVSDEAGEVTGVVVTFSDISRNLSERRYRSLVAATSDFVWRDRPDGSLLEISQAWLDLVGFSAEEAMGWKWLEAIHADDRNAYLEAWQQAIDTVSVFEHEYRLNCNDGSVRWFIDRTVPVLDDNGQVIEWIGAGQDITRRRQTDDELKRQREQYRTLVESTSAILWEGDPQTLRFTFVSQESQALLGHAPERWLAEPDFWVEHMHPDDREWAVDYCHAATQEMRQHSFDYRMIAADGRVVWLRDVVNVVVEDGRPSKLVGIMVDITATKEAERALAYVSGLQEIMVDMSEQLVAAEPGRLAETLNEILALIGAYCRVDRAYMFEFDRQVSHMSMTHEWCAPGIPPLRDQLQQRPRDTVTGMVATLEGGEVLHVPRVEDLDEAWRSDRELFEEQGIRSLVIVPIVVGDALRGYIGFDAIRQARSWNEEEIHLLRGLADTIGATIRRDHSERMLREQQVALERREYMLAASQRVARVGSWRRCIDGTELEWSDETFRILDFTPGEVEPSRERFISRIHPEDYDYVISQAWPSSGDSQPQDIEFRIMQADGAVRHVHLRSEVEYDAEGIARFYTGTLQDITEYRRTEEKLKHYRQLVEASRDLFAVVDSDYCLILANQAYADLYGANRDSLAGMHVRDVVGQELFDSLIKPNIDRCLAGESQLFETDRTYPALGTRRMLIKYHPIPSPDGSSRQCCLVMTDVTELKQAEAQLQHSLALMRIAGRVAQVGGWWVDLEQERMVLSEEIRAIRELPDDYEPTLEREFEIYAPGSLEVVRERFAACARDGRPYDEELKVVTATGRRIWVREIGEPVHDEDGTIVQVRGAFQDITAQKQAQADIEFLALYDPLTKLPNRRLLLDRLRQALAVTHRRGGHGAILFLDLDHFKTLNDTLGHDIGDRLLQQAATRLTACLRDSDTVARLGGDEFTIILADLQDTASEAIKQAWQVAEKVCADLTRPYQLGNNERQVTVSIGITLFGDSDDTVDDLMKRADLAMYQAKDAGRNTIRIFNSEMRRAVHSRVVIENALRQALGRGEIVAWFQPQVDVDGQVTGCEALARWQHPERGIVLPGEFIPIAEETGMILGLGDEVLRIACDQLAEWHADPRTSHLDVAVNISARQFHHPDFVQHVETILEETGAHPEKLWLELTESLLLADLEDTGIKMSRLKSHGIRFSLDDFGTGYSSLAYLKRLPLDQLKIDQSFVRDSLTNAEDDAIVQSIIALARTLNIGVIAEGVETEAVRKRLAEHGCLKYQGHFFSRAIPADEFDTLLHAPSPQGRR